MHFTFAGSFVGGRAIKNFHCGSVMNAEGEVTERRLTLKQIERQKLEKKSKYLVVSLVNTPGLITKYVNCRPIHRYILRIYIYYLWPIGVRQVLQDHLFVGLGNSFFTVPTCEIS